MALRAPFQSLLDAPGGPKVPPKVPKVALGAPFQAFWRYLAPPLSAIGTTFGALLPLRELVLNILGNFWYMLGSSSPQKRQLAHIFANVFSAFRSILAQVLGPGGEKERVGK